MRGGTPPADEDKDGMPDAWETARNLDPANPADGNLDRDNDGFTNVEEYLNSLAAPTVPTAIVPFGPAPRTSEGPTAGPGTDADLGKGETRPDRGGRVDARGRRLSGKVYSAGSVATFPGSTCRSRSCGAMPSSEPGP